MWLDKNIQSATLVLLLLLAGVTLFNTVQMSELRVLNARTMAVATPVSSVSGLTTASAGAQQQQVQQLDFSVIPTGVPAIYGSEVGVAYDDVSPDNPQSADATITKLGNLDRSITLEGAQKERYIAITSRISCEYCCGADSIIFPNGEAACGCAHSYAMRGVAKYLVQNHGDEFSDEEILEELGKWKTLFFPGQITAKAQILASQGIELNYVNLASNKYRDIERGASGSGMVGGC